MRFEFIAGALCLDFANTVHDSRARGNDREDDLRGISDLLEWAKDAGLLRVAQHDSLAAGYKRKPREAAEVLAKSVAIRDLLLSLFTGIANGRSVSAEHLSELNTALEKAPAVQRIHRKLGRIEAEWQSAADGLQQILFLVLRSAAELLASPRLRRVRECASAGCTWLFVDESRNHSRRWCDMRVCGNRMKARRHYQRAKAQR